MPLAHYPHPTAALQQAYNRVSEMFLVSYPVRDLPLNIRPAVIFATAGWLLLLGVLGMAPLPSIPVNDKALHFFGLGFATFLLYFIIDVPEGPARRVWYIRRAPLILTLVLAFFFGGIVSEFIQATLPWKEFQFGDIAANLLGCTVFFYLAHMLYQRKRRRQEISTLYEPLSSSTYRDAQGREHAFDGMSSPTRTGSPAPFRGPGRQARQGSNVWDDADSDPGRPSEEDTLSGRGGGPVFDIGDDEDGQGKASSMA